VSCPVSVSLGAYALDALDRAESESVRRHLAGCPRCAAESADLAELVALLRRLTGPAARDARAGTGRSACSAPLTVRRRSGPRALGG